MTEKLVLQTNALPPYAVADLEKNFDLLKLPAGAAEQQAFLKEHGRRVTAIACNGNGPVDEALLSQLPALELIACISAGLEGIDLAAAARHNVKVRTSSPALADECADVAVSLVVGMTRGTLAADRFVREGKWLKGQFPLGTAIKGLRIGILGLGHIGEAIARRLEVMGADIAYHGPRRKPSKHRYFPSLLELANWSRMIIVACPGGEATKHLVNREVIEAIGPDGWLVNISRGTVVDEAALITALKAGKIAGFGSDVFEHEPKVPSELIESDKTLLLPHYGSGTKETRLAMAQAVIDALKEHFASKKAPAPASA